jgi:protein-disulfide isomerase
MRITHIIALTLTLVFAGAAEAREISRTELVKAFEKHPDVLIVAIKSNAKAILALLAETAAAEQARLQKVAAEAEQKAFEDSFTNPLQPAIEAARPIRGATNAKYTLVEYADFECPFCAAGYKTVEELRKQYGGELRFVFKHVPLPFHPHALEAAQWFEAIAAESPEAAWKFHDILFEHQDQLSSVFFRQTAAELGLDVTQCEKRAASQAVKDRIAADTAEATRLGFSGTPAFLLNGVPVKGAYPAEHFKDIVARLAGQVRPPAAVAAR